MDTHSFMLSGTCQVVEPAVRGEGVGIVLDKQATLAWREAGEI